jgi:hypothetical protein
MLVTISSWFSVRVIVTVEWADDELGPRARVPEKSGESCELAREPRAMRTEGRIAPSTVTGSGN